MINATKDKLASFFQGNSQFVVPFFQRAYVWDDENWTTFWEHTKSVLERFEEAKLAEHFIGTIITKQLPAQQIGQSVYELIDGQQRLMTVALFLQAISDASGGQLPNLKGTISGHLRFQDARGVVFSRIQPSDYDQPWFDAILSNDPAGPPDRDHKISRAHRFFLDQVNGFPDERLDRLRLVILERVPLISMLLSADDDEQEIFDTINALGVKLTTGELLKNYIFKDRSIRGQYVPLWKDVYEANEERIEFWDSDKTAGRITRTNIEVLLYCYLIIKLGTEVKLESLFKEYKSWLEGKTPEDKVIFLTELKGYADTYFSFPSGNELNQIGFPEAEKRFFHAIENLMVTTVYPLVLYIYINVKRPEARLELLGILETYVVRRNICRLTTKNYNLLFIQIINRLEDTWRKGEERGGRQLTEVIGHFEEPTNLMPSDGALEIAFRNEALSNQNAREVLFLLALYQSSTGLADMPELSLGNYSVEHIMPTKWETHWRDREMNPQEKAERSRKLKTLGNLTLVTQRLNATMQNAGWTEKKEHLRRNSSLRMTTEYLV